MGFEKRPEAVDLYEVEREVIDGWKFEVKLLSLVQMLLCVIKHPILQIELNLPTKEDAWVEQIFSPSSAIMLVEVS